MFKIGDKIAINNAGCGYPVGTQMTISSIPRGSGVNYRVREYPNSTFYAGDFDILVTTMEDLTNLHIEAVNTVKLIEMKMAYLKETSSTTFDDSEFKAFSILKELDTKATTFEKAKAIANIMSK